MKKGLIVLALVGSLFVNGQSKTPFAIGNNPGWYGMQFTDEQIHQLMFEAGNRSTRYFITLDAWANYGMKTFDNRIGNVYAMGFRHNAFALTKQFYTDYKDQDTKIIADKYDTSKKLRTGLPKGLSEPIFLPSGEVNPANRYAVYCNEAVIHFGEYFEYWEVWNEPDITYETNLADDPNLTHDANSWWNVEPHPSQLYNLVGTVKDYIRLCEIANKVIKKYKPNAKICTGGLGYPAFGYQFFKQGGGKWVDVLSVHFYPSYYLREWDNGFVYNRHSDYIISKLVERVNIWKSILVQFSKSNLEIICTEVNIPRFSPDPVYTTSETQQVNFTLKLFFKFLEAGVSRTWLFNAGEDQDKATGQNMFSFMGMYENLTTTTPGHTKILPQGITCKTLFQLLNGAVYDKKLTASMNLQPTKLDGVALILPNKKKAFVVWAKTKKDLNENVFWSWRIINFKPSAYLKYDWNGNAVEVKDQLQTLSATPSIFIEK